MMMLPQSSQCLMVHFSLTPTLKETKSLWVCLLCFHLTPHLALLFACIAMGACTSMMCNLKRFDFFTLPSLLSLWLKNLSLGNATEDLFFPQCIYECVHVLWCATPSLVHVFNICGKGLHSTVSYLPSHWFVTFGSLVKISSKAREEWLSNVLIYFHVSNRNALEEALPRIYAVREEEKMRPLTRLLFKLTGIRRFWTWATAVIFTTLAYFSYKQKCIYLFAIRIVPNLL